MLVLVARQFLWLFSVESWCFVVVGEVLRWLWCFAADIDVVVFLRQCGFLRLLWCLLVIYPVSSDVYCGCRHCRRLKRWLVASLGGRRSLFGCGSHLFLIPDKDHFNQPSWFGFLACSGFQVLVHCVPQSVQCLFSLLSLVQDRFIPFLSPFGVFFDWFIGFLFGSDYIQTG
jgi:hypothetical protein